MKQTLSQQYLKSQINYDPTTGIFLWLERKQGRYMGKPVGCLSIGYLSIRIAGKLYRAHRLAWLFMTGSFPKDQIDHINNIRNDNRWINLRQCNQSQNCANTGKRKNNTSGFKGVYWSRNAKKWHASVRFKRKNFHLGYFNDKIDAAKAYNVAATKYFGKFAFQNKITG